MTATPGYPLGKARSPPGLSRRNQRLFTTIEPHHDTTLHLRECARRVPAELVIIPVWHRSTSRKRNVVRCSQCRHRTRRSPDSFFNKEIRKRRSVLPQHKALYCAIGDCANGQGAIAVSDPASGSESISTKLSHPECGVCEVVGARSVRRSADIETSDGRLTGSGVDGSLAVL